MEQDKSVFLLYEGDEWLSNDSMVLMGVFSSEESLKFNAEKLIRQRGDEHLDCAEYQNFFDYNETFNKDEKISLVIDDILMELLSRGATSGWSTNYSYQEATLDELGEI